MGRAVNALGRSLAPASKVGAESPSGTRSCQKRRPLLAMLVIVSASLGISATPAQAFNANVFTTTFGAADSNPANPYPLTSPSDVAVDNSAGTSAHDLYVSDTANHSVEKFTSAGSLILISGKGVNKTKVEESSSTEAEQNVCVVSLYTCQNAVAASTPGAFQTPAFVAVDGSTGPSDGDVYVADTGTGLISKFNPAGNLITSWGSEGQISISGGLAGIAVDAAGNLLVLNGTPQVFTFDQGGVQTEEFNLDCCVTAVGLAVDSNQELYRVRGSESIQKFDAASPDIGETFGSEVTGLMALPNTTELYVDEHGGNLISHYGPCDPTLESCSTANSFGSGHLNSASGISSDGTSGTVYAADTGEGTVAVFDAVVLPDVTTGPPTEPNQTSGTLTGSVDPSDGGAVTGCKFEYGQNVSYGDGTVPCEPAAPYSGAQEVTAKLTGLTPETTYHYRLAASNANGENFGHDETYTPHSVVGLTTERPTDVTSTGAQINGAFVGNGEDTHYYFEWGTESSYGNVTAIAPGVDAGSPQGPNPTVESSTLSGLSPATEYHYRIVASNHVGTSYGSDQAFKTAPAVAELKTEKVVGVSSTLATLTASFVGNGEDTHYYFEWGPSESYGQTTAIPPGSDAGSPPGPHPTSISAEVTGLDPATTYDYRVVASNGAGTTDGANETLETPPSAPLVSESVSNVSSDSVLLHGEINPGGSETKYRFEYAAEEVFKSNGVYTYDTPIEDAGSGVTYVAVSAQLSHLTPGETYHWRLVAENVEGSIKAGDRTFTTYPFIPVINDPCANKHVRQQSGAAQLLDCRAYELVSAANSGGYDVESDLLPDQSPYAGYPEAEGRLLYAVHDGGIPGTNNPTNRGPDPYIATRGSEGWSTEYVGVPANDPFSTKPFSSVPSAASSNLETFAFGGPEGCSPCFEGGYTGIPVRLPNGQLVQGMVGGPRF